MKPSRVQEVLEKLITTRWPAFIWGPPGVGKSSIVRTVGKKLELPVIDIRAALLDPTDLRGIPFIENGTAKWSAPSFLPSDPDSKGLLFFDELSSAPPLVQASLYQLTLDRQVGDYKLPAGWSIVAAGNRAQDASIAFRMPAALSNRFIHLDFEVDFEDWRLWATDHRVHPAVIAFLSFRRVLLFDMTKPERGFPTPRSWAMVSDTIKLFPAVQDASDVLLGIIGEPATIEFLAFLADSRISEIVEALTQNPRQAPLPERIDHRFALVSFLGASIDEKGILDVCLILLERLETEIAVLLLREILRKRPTAVVREEVREFLRVNQEVVTV